MFGMTRPRQRMGASLMGENAPQLPPGLDPNMPWPTSPGRAVQPYQMPPVVPQDQAPQQQPRAGFNAPGGWGERLNAIGGTLRDDDSGQAIANYQQLQQQRAESEAKAQQAQAERETKFTDWQRQYDYQRANPTASAAQPYRFEDNAGNVYERDAATGQNRLIFTDPNDKTYIQDGQLVKVTNVVRQGQAAPSQTPTVLGRELPQGWTVQGGPASQAPGNFRR